MPAQKLKADAGHEVYTITAEQLAEWKKAAEPLETVWADNVKKAGGDPDAIMKELKAIAREVQRGVLMRPRRSTANRSRRRDGRAPSHVSRADCDGAGGDDARADAAQCVAQARPWTASSTPSSWIAAIFVGIVAADIFISVLLRYFFSVQIPDATTSASCCSAS